MNLLLLESTDFNTDGTAVITGRRCRQLVDVIRATAGKRCKAGILGGKCGTAEILSITPDECRVNFTPEKEPPVKHDVVLIAALPRPQSLCKVLHCATTMGVKKICFIQTFKVEKSYWASPRLEAGEIRDELILALEQCGDTILPEVCFFRTFKPFIEDELDNLAVGTRLLGDPAGDPAEFHDAATLAIGPEGGFTDYEKEMFYQHGFSPVSLGDRILRTEFAVAGLLARLIR